MTLKEFKQKHKNSGYCLVAAEDIKGFVHKGNSLYGNCDNMEVVKYFYHPENETDGIYTVYLK